MSRKGIFALEELDPAAEEAARVEQERLAAEAAEAEELRLATERATPEALAEAEVDAGVSRVEAVVAEVEAAADVIAEAVQIRDTVDTLVERINTRIAEADAAAEPVIPEVDPLADPTAAPAAAPEATPAEAPAAAAAPAERVVPAEERGISDEAAEALEVAVEHFRVRLDFKKKVVPALENFSVPGKRREVSMEALANLKNLSERTTVMIGIAQEGMVDRITNSFSLLFSTENGLKKQLAAVSKKFDKAGGKEAGEIKEPAWGKQIPTSKKEVDASVIVDAIKHFTSVNVKEATKLINDSVALAKEVYVEDAAIAIAPADLAKVRELLVRGENLKKEVMTVREAAEGGAGKTFAVLDKAGKDKLVAAVDAMLGDERLLEAHAKTYEDFAKYFVNSQSFFKPKIWKEVRSALDAAEYQLVLEFRKRLAIAHAAVKYIAASTK
jgi:predicted RNA-binding Zn ribbon-like protein